MSHIVNQLLCDRILVGEVIGIRRVEVAARCLTVSTYRACRPRSRAARILFERRLHRRRAQPPFLGHPQSHCECENWLHRNPPVAEPEKIVPARGALFSFGAFNRDFLATREGFSMLILNSSNASTMRALRAAGIGASCYSTSPAKRQSRTNAGEARVLRWLRLDPASPNLRFAACQHHFPGNFWDPAFQIHAMASRTIAGAAMVADNPTTITSSWKSFTGVTDLHSSSIASRQHRNGISDHGAVAFRGSVGVSPDGTARG